MGKTARLNSHRLLENTNLTLFTINKRTLVSWFKDTARRDEIKVLMQGLSLPAPRLCASESLPPAQQQPSTPPDPPPQQHQHEEPEDKIGLAQVRYKAPAVNVASLSRTTMWRQRKKAAIQSSAIASTFPATALLCNWKACVLQTLRLTTSRSCMMTCCNTINNQ